MSAAAFVRRPGEYGTLYLYRVRYADEYFERDGSPCFDWLTYAYSEEHAVDRFYESGDGDGWIHLSATRVREG